MCKPRINSLNINNLYKIFTVEKDGVQIPIDDVLRFLEYLKVKIKKGEIKK